MDFVPYILPTKRTSSNPSVNLTRMGTLYVIVSLCQASWLYLVISNNEIAIRFTGIPIIGWALIGIWMLMVWCTPYLFYLGARMIQIIRNHSILIKQTRNDRRRQKIIALLLFLGIVLDITLFPFMLTLEDKSIVIFMSGFVGGRVLQANIEAIMQYYNLSQPQKGGRHSPLPRWSCFSYSQFPFHNFLQKHDGGVYFLRYQITRHYLTNILISVKIYFQPQRTHIQCKSTTTVTTSSLTREPQFHEPRHWEERDPTDSTTPTIFFGWGVCSGVGFLWESPWQ